MSLKSKLLETLGAEEFSDVVHHEGGNELHSIDAELNAETAEIAEIHHEIEQVDSDIAQLEERAEHLNENVDGLESMLTGSRTWNPGLAQHFYNSASRITDKTFGEDYRRSIKGAESFSDERTAKIELYAGVEDFKEKVRSMYEAVKEWIIKMYNKAVEFFKSIFTAYGRIRKKAKAVAERAANASEVGTEKIKAGKWNVYCGGDSAKTHTFITGSAANVKSIQKAMVEQTGNSVYDKLKQLLKSMSSTMKLTTEKSDSVTQTYKTSVGGVEYTLTSPNTEDVEKQPGALSSSGIKYKINAKLTPTGELVARVPKGRIESDAKSIEKLAEELEKNKVDAKSLNIARDKAIATITANSGKDDKTVPVIKAANTCIVKLATTANKLTILSMSAYLDYMVASLAK